MPKLSIITINLNNKDGLLKTIESVVSQNSNDFEYIVIDGGSTDGSVEVIKKYADKISYWTSEKDTGIYNAMNKGILKAQGEYCQFLNSGDYLVNNDVIKNITPYLNTNSIVYGNMLKLLKDRVYKNGEIKTNSMLTYYTGTLNHSSSFIKKELFVKYGMYDEQLKIVSDWKFFLIAIGLNNELVKYMDEDITYFNMDGISNRDKSLDKLERRKVLEEIIPPNILTDYDNYWQDIQKMGRIKRYKFVYAVVGLMERVLFMYEKMRSKKIF